MVGWPSGQAAKILWAAGDHQPAVTIHRGRTRMTQIDDLSRSLIALDQNSTLIAVVEMRGLPQDWGSGGNRHWRESIVGRPEPLSEAGTECAIVNGAANLQQEIGTSS